MELLWEKNFKFSIIEECGKNETLDREQYYLDLYKSYNSKYGYNVSRSAIAPMMGRKFSEETRKLLSEGVRNRDASCWTRGEDKFNAKLTNEDIINIKRMLYEGKRTIDIAELYNVEANTITQIKTGERWSHVKTEYDDLIVQTPRQKLTDMNEVIDIKRRLAEGEDTISISELYNISRGSVYAIKQLRVWKEIGSEYNDSIKNRPIQRKLNSKQVLEIIELIKDGKLLYKDIAKKYNISLSTLRDIKKKYDAKIKLQEVS